MNYWSVRIGRFHRRTSLSVGFFLGIRPSFNEQYAESAEEYIRAINAALRAQNLGPYIEADPPNVYTDSYFGRSALDHDSARLIATFADRVRKRQHAPHLSLLAENTYRVAFVPVDFTDPLLTEYSETLFGDETPIWAGSSPALLRELIASAELLRIPIEEGVLRDDIAAKINDYEPLFDGDAIDPNSDLRTTWLVLHEGARLSVEHRIALSLAG